MRKIWNQAAILGMVILILMTAIATWSCTPLNAERATARSAARHDALVLLFDTSGSVNSSLNSQREHWQRASRPVLSELNFGDNLTIYSIDGRTTDRAAAFHVDVPEGGGLTKDANARTARGAAKADAAEAIDALFTRPPSPHSNVVGAAMLIPRPVDCGCRVRVWLFSDMLNDLPPLDLERVKVTDPAVAARTVIDAFEFEPGSLSGVEIAVVLDDVVDESRIGINSRTVLKAVYQELFERHLGARLVQFDANESLLIHARVQQ